MLQVRCPAGSMAVQISIPGNPGYHPQPGLRLEAPPNPSNFSIQHTSANISRCDNSIVSPQVIQRTTGIPDIVPGVGPPSKSVNNVNALSSASSAASDGRRMRNKPNMRRTADYNSTIVNYVQNRIWQRDIRDMRALQPDFCYNHMMMPPVMLMHKPVNCIVTRCVRTATNKIKCPVFCTCWTPEGRRLVTGASSGEFTLWNGLTFGFETILQAHDTAVRSMIWSHNDQWMLTGDHGGFVKYWQTNMNNVKMFQIHKDPIRGLSFSPTDQKFASCSDDGTVRIWDFVRCYEEKILRGHGSDVKCVDWHPHKSLVASGSKDTQQPIKLWDPRTGASLATIHAHKHTVMDMKWNRNGRWLLTASRDHLLKLFDIRNMKEEVLAFRGHKKETTTVEWHPVHESLFVSGGSDGAIMYWLADNDKELGCIDEAHDTMVWSLSWHPLGHVLVSGSNDHTTKFWARNRLGDAMKDRYNLNTLPYGSVDDTLDEIDCSCSTVVPGTELSQHGTFRRHEATTPATVETDTVATAAAIPGLDFSPSESHSADADGVSVNSAARMMMTRRKPIFTKPVPRAFERAWAEGREPAAVSSDGMPVGGPTCEISVGLLGESPDDDSAVARIQAFHPTLMRQQQSHRPSRPLLDGPPRAGMMQRPRPLLPLPRQHEFDDSDQPAPPLAQFGGGLTGDAPWRRPGDAEHMPSLLDIDVPPPLVSIDPTAPAHFRSPPDCMPANCAGPNDRYSAGDSVPWRSSGKARGSRGRGMRSGPR